MVWFPEDVGLKRNGSDSINNWGAIRDNWKSYFFIIVKSKSKTALKVAYLTNEYHTGSALGRETFRKRPLMCFYIYLFGITRLSSMKATDQTDSAIKCLTGALQGSSKKVLGVRGSEIMWSKQGQSISWPVMNGSRWTALMWRNCIKTQTLACSALIRLMDQCLWTVDYPWRAQGGAKSNLRCCS